MKRSPNGEKRIDRRSDRGAALLGGLDRLERHVIGDPSPSEEGEGAGLRRDELPVLPRRETPEEGRGDSQRARQVADRREGKTGREGSRRRLAEGLPRRQEVIR